MKLPIGRLDRRITLQTLVQSQGAVYGEPTEQYRDFATVAAAALPLSGREIAAARQIDSKVNAQFQIRYLPGVDSTMRILYGGDAYDIQSVEEVGRRERLNIFAALA
jgi:SPP1 family predicted phage head-tail adaptor